MTQVLRSLNKILRQGLNAFYETLKSVEMVSVLHPFSSGQGNYSEERHQLLENLTMEDILLDLEKIRQANKDIQE